MAVPADGKLPFDGCFPALIQWEGALHPARALPESGLRLTRLEIAHPQADALRGFYAARNIDADCASFFDDIPARLARVLALVASATVSTGRPLSRASSTATCGT